MHSKSYTDAMNDMPSLHNVLAAFAAVLLLSAGTLALSGCGGGGSAGGAGGQQGEQSIHLVYVNWVEGVALAHVLDALLTDSLGMDVQRTQVSGAGTAFSSVASGDADVFTEVWLPTTHASGWKKYKDQLQKVGQWYDSTSVGLVVPAYTDIKSVSDLSEYRQELNGEIQGIESGANVNQQARQILENNNIQGFNVVSASSPATWASVQRAIENKEPIVATGWKPHWKWSRFDLRYLEGAQTGQTDVFGSPEQIVMLADTSFENRYSDRVVQFFENVQINDDEALNSLMGPFEPNSDVNDKMAAARKWIQNHQELVAEWVPSGSTSDTTAVANASQQQ